jgi:hypothetical protein
MFYKTILIKKIISNHGIMILNFDESSVKIGQQRWREMKTKELALS